MPMTSTQMANATEALWAYFLALLRVLAGFISIGVLTISVVQFSVWAMSDRIEDLIRKTGDLDRTEASLAELTEKVGRLADSLKEIDLPAIAETVVSLERVASERHPPEVVEVDAYRSGVFDESGQKGRCPTEGPCEARYLLQRTPLGMGCDVPAVISRAILDKDRVSRLAYPAETASEPTAVQGDWEPRSVFFRPFGAPPGPAQFNLVLEYPCGDRTIRQALDPLPFILTDGETP